MLGSNNNVYNDDESDCNRIQLESKIDCENRNQFASLFRLKSLRDVNFHGFIFDCFDRDFRGFHDKSLIHSRVV